MTKQRKGLGRGLSALIPDAEMEFLSQVARGDDTVNAIPFNTGQMAIKTSAESSGSVKVARTSRSTAISQGQNQQKSVEEISTGPQSFTTLDQQHASGLDTAPERTVMWLTLNDIRPNPFQPRRSFDEKELADLAVSIKEHGILQPILVRQSAPNSDGTQLEQYELIAGERRWRAAQRAGLKLIPAIIRPVNDQQALELAVIENVQRHDISPLDTALAYKRLSKEFKLSQETIARRVGKSRPAIANAIRLLELPEEIKSAMNDGLLSEGHGRAILLAEGDGARRAVFRRVLRDKLSVRETEETARAVPVDRKDQDGQQSPTRPATAKGALTSVELEELQQTAQKLMGRRVTVRTRRKGGFLIVPFVDTKDLTELIHHFKSEV